MTRAGTHREGQRPAPTPAQGNALGIAPVVPMSPDGATQTAGIRSPLQGSIYACTLTQGVALGWVRSGLRPSPAPWASALPIHCPPNCQPRSNELDASATVSKMETVRQAGDEQVHRPDRYPPPCRGRCRMTRSGIHREGQRPAPTPAQGNALGIAPAVPMSPEGATQSRGAG